VLELETRRELFDVVRAFPGLHMREIQRKVGLSIALTEYHLRVLTKTGLVTETTEGGYKRYYPAPEEGGRGMGSRERRMLGTLRQSIPLRITLLLLKMGQATNKDMSDALGLSPSRLSFHLKKLLKAGVIRQLPRAEGKGYALEDPDTTLRLLVTNRPPPDILDECTDLWEELGL
jgi:predicted transcriptional regulator